MATLCLQETFSPKSFCFGCGPDNSQGLRIRSMVDPDVFSADKKPEVSADWQPSPHHQAFEGMVNGGIIGSLLDCHSNWTASYTLMRIQGLPSPPCTVTASYSVKLLRPTPSTGPLHLEAKVVGYDPARPDRAKVEATLSSGGVVCATCEGVFVAVKPGHPAYHRW